MITVLLVLIFACNAFQVFALTILMFNTKDIADKLSFIIRWKTKDMRTKLHLNSMYGKMVYADTDSVRTEKEGNYDKV